MRRGRSQECKVRPDWGNGYLILTSRSLWGGDSPDLGKLDRSRTESALYFVLLTICSVSTWLQYSTFFTELPAKYWRWGRGRLLLLWQLFLSNDAVFQAMTTPSTNLASAARGTTTSTPRLTSTREVISSLTFTTSHWGGGKESRSGTSAERALTGVHFQNRTVSSCLQQKTHTLLTLIYSRTFMNSSSRHSRNSTGVNSEKNDWLNSIVNVISNNCAFPNVTFQNVYCEK